MIHSSLNTSNHSPIFIILEVGKLNVHIENVPSCERTDWPKATDKHQDNYCNAVSKSLIRVNIAECVGCRNLYWIDHFESIVIHRI